MSKKYLTEIVHTVIVPFDYHVQGQVQKSQSITVKAPSNLILLDVAVLDEEQSKAMLNAMEKFSKVGGSQAADSTKEKNADEDALQFAFAMSAGGANMARCYQSFQRILEASALIDGKEKLTQHLFNAMSPQDTKILMGKYLTSFLAFSLAD